jgi:amidase
MSFDSSRLSRREALGLGLMLTGAGCSASRSLDVEEVPLHELRRKIENREISARALTEAYLDRISRVDELTHAVIELNPDAVSIASELDRLLDQGRPKGPLHGIPILIKDNIDTGDRMMTTAGSLALEGPPAPADSGVAKRLRDAGAVILGKTNLSEWANIRSTRSTSGWSGRGGLTRNPYSLDRNCSGSSSGSGAAAAASLCAAAIGTETDGSIVSPSSLNCLVGFKPTVGLLSGRGIIPISHTQDTAGPMARCVRDAALVLGAIQEPREGTTNDYSRYLDDQGLRGARIGIARQFWGSNGDIVKIGNDAIEVMKHLGADVVEDVKLDMQYGGAETDIMMYELKAGLNAYLAGRPGLKVKTLAGVIEFNNRNAARELQYFGQENFLTSQAKGDLKSKPYLDAVDKCRRMSRTDGIDAALAKYKLDAIFSITDGPAWITDYINGDHTTISCSTPAAVAGYPHITVPGGFVHGLPIGVSFFSTAWTEARLIRYGYSFEQATKVRRKPGYAPAVRISSDPRP